MTFFLQAAELYVQVDMIQEAADAFMECKEFDKAKSVCRDYAPELESYVDQKYKSYLKTHGDAGQVITFVVTRFRDSRGD